MGKRCMSSGNQQNGVEREARSIFGFFIAKFRLTYLILGAIILLGSFSLFTLPCEADPEVQIPFAVASAMYQGATPQDMEALITDKLEDKIATLEHVRRFTSSSSTGIASIFVEYEAEADL